MTGETPDAPRGTPIAGGPWIAAGVLGFLVLAGVKTTLDAGQAREAAEQARKDSLAATRALAEARDAAARSAGEMAALRADVEMLSTSVDAVQKQIKEIADRQTFGGDSGGPGGNPFGPRPGTDPGGVDAPPAQPFLEFTPELRESLRKASAAKGVTLLEDRVVFPGRVVLRQGSLEYLAVFPGGKAHESIFLLAGEPDGDGTAPKGLGATLNSCLMAIGLRPGTPPRPISMDRTIPAKGTPVFLSVEWEEEGKVVRVNAEDFLWDRERNRSLDPGKFIYVGSYFDPGGEGYVPDLTGDAVDCYSAAAAIVDIDDPRAANDQIFVACGPRIPPEGTTIRMIFSAKAVPPTRSWDPQAPEKVTGGPAVPMPAESPPGGGKEGAGGGK